MYKFVSIEEYKKNYSESHPDAVKSPDKTEVVLSINGPCVDCITLAEALRYIEENWNRD